MAEQFECAKCHRSFDAGSVGLVTLNNNLVWCCEDCLAIETDSKTYEDGLADMWLNLEKVCKHNNGDGTCNLEDVNCCRAVCPVCKGE